MTSVDGLISGLDTTTIISQLMAVERLPEQQLTNSKTASQTMVSTLQQLNTLMTSLQTAAKAFVPDTITKQSAWSTTTAASSNSGLAAALAGTGALAGSSTFSVTRVAAAGAAVSSGTVSSLTAAVASGPFLVTKGAPALGLTGVDPGATLSSGTHSIEVTQSSAGAAVTGTAALPSTVTIDSGNNTIAFYLDGSSTPTSISLSSGTYTPSQLASEIGRASGGTLTATVDTSGRLQLSTVEEGSDAGLQLAGSGTANAALGLTDTTTVSHGVDGLISLDGGAATTVSNAVAGTAVTLVGAGGDSVVATLAGGLRSGVATTSSVDVAAGATLADVVSALNDPSTGVSATAVQVGTAAYRLQLTSTTTGSASDVTVSSGAFPAGQSTLGDMQQLSAGADTVLRVGTGPGAFDVTSSTASVTGLMPGVTISAVKADPSTPVTVKVSADVAGMADKMATLVDQANSVLSYLSSKSSYDATSKTGGPLVGDSLARDLAQRITDTVIGSSSSTPAMDGVSVSRDGSLTFDRTAFLAAYADDPAGVTSTMTAMSQQLSDVATAASDPVSGTLTTRITAEQDSIRGYTDQIAAFEDRMTLRQQTLQTQYAALETMLGTLKSQSDWLAGQLASLPTYTYGSSK